jgi:hypothetical protein
VRCASARAMRRLALCVPCFRSKPLECVAVGVCTAVNGIVPLAGRRAHLGFYSKCIAPTTSCRKAHWPQSPRCSRCSSSSLDGWT